MAQINKPTDYFTPITYTGTSSSHSITTGFQPDWVWIKGRSFADAHYIFDSIRGVTNAIFSHSAAAESSNVNSLTSFDSDGFTVGSEGGVNGSGQSLVAWNWLAGGTASSNTDGSITSSVSANTTSGFSIVSYSGNSSSATVGHGLGVAPKMIIIKHRNDVDDWTCYHASLGSSQRIQLNNTGAASALSWGGDPTSSVFYLLGGGATAVNVTGGTYIAYCFAEKKGFSKFGSYTGNGSADGPFIYTGFKPAWFLLKRYDSGSSANWEVYDTTRDTYNQAVKRLAPSLSDAEATNFALGDILSNGVKIRQTDQTWNASGGTYIYMAFAESPLVGTNNIPATAR